MAQAMVEGLALVSMDEGLEGDGSGGAVGMMNKVPANVPRIIPKYVAATANTAIDLGTAPVELRTSRATVTSFGKARLELTDKERVVVEVDTTFDGYTIADDPDLKMKFGARGQVIPVIATKSQISGHGGKVWLLVNGSAFTQVRDGRVRLSSAIVHILNFPEFYCLGGSTSDFQHANRRLGRVVFRNSDWDIELQALPSTHAIVEQLKSKGGNAITHVARIIRADRRVFTCKQLEMIIHDLQRFLSFARGSWTSVFGTVGYDRNGNELYEDWSQRIATPWQVCRSWFDIHHGETLCAAFPGFVRLMHDPLLAKAGYAALHWYLRSNRAGEGPGVDGGLILSQAALEGLSMSVLSKAGVTLPRKANAAERIRAACQHLKIRVEIPAFCKTMRLWHRQGAFSDGPEAITRLRNELVHPKRLLPRKIPSAVPEASKLAQWYIEVMLLKLCGYQGVYSHRLAAKWVGQVQPFR
ncbi:MAG: hypothetical protein KF810_20555 [Rhizobiaceae bacterium]|nr:hypothetical protein [Rhizobiaceae bacterium]